MSMAPQPPAAPRDRLGRPLRDLRLSVIEACNFRCGYCMPADRVPDDYGLDAASRLSFDQIETLVRAAARLGVTKLRLTGGEPLLRKGLAALVARFRGTGHVLRFIEYMDVGTCNGWRRDGVVPSSELRARIHARWPLRPLDAQYRGEVAERHGFLDGGGEIGFVSSVTAPFCGDCHRARVSADGRLYTCLFADAGTDLRAAIEAGEAAVAARLAELWRARADRYSEIRGSGRTPRRRVEMFLVGG